MFIGIIIGMPYLSIRQARRWQGGWRLLALLPLAPMAFVTLRIIVDTARDPTSHNLWPFELIMFAGGGLLFLGPVIAARRLLHGPDHGAPPPPIRWTELPLLRWGAIGIGLYFIPYGFVVLRSGEPRGGAAISVLAAVAVWWGVTGKVPAWFGRR